MKSIFWIFWWVKPLSERIKTFRIKLFDRSLRICTIHTALSIWYLRSWSDWKRFVQISNKTWSRSSITRTKGEDIRERKRKRKQLKSFSSLVSLIWDQVGSRGKFPFPLTLVDPPSVYCICIKSIQDVRYIFVFM